MAKRALISVCDKSGLVKFTRGLVKLGWEIIASGGTARRLRRAGLKVIDVATITGMPEMLNGRVKTLHPAIHAGILARGIKADHAELKAQGISLIDLVVCNLYPFEQIDVGGVALLRAAAKNFQRVIIVCDPVDYETVLNQLKKNGRVDISIRRYLATKAFSHTCSYDSAIANYLSSRDKQGSNLPKRLHLDFTKVQSLRYGENPHQLGGLYAIRTTAGPLGGHQLQGKTLSYNNLLDLDAAWRAAASFTEACVVIVKHVSPCGIAVSNTLTTAFPAALASDPISAFGGVVAVNRRVTIRFVEAIARAKLFIEAIAAPGFSSKAQQWFTKNKKNCRLIALSDLSTGVTASLEIRTVHHGYVVQEQDKGDPAEANWKTVTQRQPSQTERRTLRFAWQAVQHIKSNAIVFAVSNATVGIGSGLPSRVDAVKMATMKAGRRVKGAVMASDAFFSFTDGIEAAAASGVTAVIQPGGSIHDKVIIEAANRLDLAMIFTGVRHFRH